MIIYCYETEPGLLDTNLSDTINQLVACKIVQASPQLSNALNSWDGESSLVPHLIQSVDEPSLTQNRILIATTKDSLFSDWCISQCGHALWGCSNEFISVDYSPPESRLANQLHECLHFVGVEDCYEEHDPSHPPKASCNNQTCVMRYGNNTLEICDSVRNQIQDRQTYKLRLAI